MNIRYRVTLTQCERDELGVLLSGAAPRALTPAAAVCVGIGVGLGVCGVDEPAPPPQLTSASDKTRAIKGYLRVFMLYLSVRRMIEPAMRPFSRHL